MPFAPNSLQNKLAEITSSGALQINTDARWAEREANSLVSSSGSRLLSFAVFIVTLHLWVDCSAQW